MQKALIQGAPWREEAWADGRREFGDRSRALASLLAIAAGMMMFASPVAFPTSATAAEPNAYGPLLAVATPWPAVPTSPMRDLRLASSKFGQEAKQVDIGLMLSAGQVTPSPTATSAEPSFDFSSKPITQVKTNIDPSPGKLPPDYAANRFAGEETTAAGATLAEEQVGQVFFWQSPAFCHRPLYFEQPNLERYGYCHGVFQPALSAAHFFATVPILPYKMVVERPRECICTVAGDHASCESPFPPWHRGAALAEGAAIAGMIFLIP